MLVCILCNVSMLHRHMCDMQWECLDPLTMSALISVLDLAGWEKVSKCINAMAHITAQSEGCCYETPLQGFRALLVLQGILATQEPASSCASQLKSLSHTRCRCVLTSQLKNHPHIQCRCVLTSQLQNLSHTHCRCVLTKCNQSQPTIRTP